ncbi:hypothetical protein [Patulibacter minatonensis]|uniref:hypothetical protein n=1 Tax=Patulibacter minatonensis TaxID=298163 RepID=UPI0004799230|nr:hypothetical protein [Patulibacter minatonensis]
MPARRSATLVAALALAAVPSTASAASGSQRTSGTGFDTAATYTVTFQGSGSYARNQSTTDGASGTTTSTFRWTSVYRNVLIPARANRSTVGFPATTKGSGATGDWKITSHQPDGTDDCEGDGSLGRLGVPGGGGGTVTDGGVRLVRTKAGGVQVLAQATNGFSTLTGGGDGSSACHPKDFWHDVILSGAGVGQAEESAEPLTGFTKVTDAELRRRSFTKTVLLPVDEAPPGDCGSGDGTTCTQTYAWTGKVTFDRKATPTKKKKKARRTKRSTTTHR